MNNSSHAPDKYICPICLGVRGVENDATLMRSSDKVLSDELVTGFINSFFIGKNSGHVIIVPNQHHENIYDVPQAVGHRIFDRAKQVAIVMKREYGCDGVTIRQNNEPAGDQHAFHFHLHVFPRYQDDGYNQAKPADKRLAEPSERAEYALRLRGYLA